MAKPEPKLTYIPNQTRIRCEFTKAMADALAHAPYDLMERARKKLETEKSKGNIEFYYTYETRLARIWETLRKTKVESDTVVGVTLASGCPSLPGLKVELTNDDYAIGRITIDNNRQEILGWQHFHLKLAVKHQLQQLGSKAIPNPAQIHRLWIRASGGSKVKSIPLEPMPAQKSQKPYLLIEEDEDRDLTLVVFDTRIFYQQSTWQSLINEIDLKIKQCNKSSGCNYLFLYNHLVRTIRSASRGPERYGMDLPLVCLVAIDGKYVGENAKVAAQARKPDENNQEGTQEKRTLKGAQSSRRISPLVLQISDDKMIVQVTTDTVMELIQHKKLIDKDWIIEQLKSQKIYPDAFCEYVDEFVAQISDGKVPRDLTLAKGEIESVGEEPYLEYVFQKKGRESEKVDIRDKQQKTYVAKGELIARIGYKKPEVIGFNVFGNQKKPPVGPKMDVEIGHGVTSQDGRNFYALFDGRVVMEAKSIRLEEILKHDGDVNLLSGNIKYNGVVVIEGSIDSGAFVETGSELKVNGSIAGSALAQKDIIVEEGINNFNKGFVRSHGDLTASFIENSEVRVSGNLKIKNLIMNARVYCEKSIETTSVIGGMVYFGEAMACQSLGQGSGADTKVYIGYNPDFKRRHTIRVDRYNKLLTFQKEYRGQIKLISEKSENRHKSVKEQDAEKVAIITNNLKRVEGLIEKAKAQMDAAEEQIKPNPDSVITVSGTLYPGVVFYNGENEMRVTSEVSGIKVVTKNNLKMKIVSLTDENSAA